LCHLFGTRALSLSVTMADAAEKRRLAREKRKARVLNNTTDRLASLNSAFKADIDTEPTMPSSAPLKLSDTSPEKRQTVEMSTLPDALPTATSQSGPARAKPTPEPLETTDPSSPKTIQSHSAQWTLPLSLITFIVATSTAFGMHLLVRIALVIFNCNFNPSLAGSARRLVQRPLPTWLATASSCCQASLSSVCSTSCLL
jgi:hypothetical protein